MEDREMLELAARAAGYLAHFDIVEVIDGVEYYCVCDWNDRDVDACWNPLHDDGDRYRLARKLGLVLDFSDATMHEVRFWIGNEECPRTFQWPAGDEKAEAYSIVRAAAELGKVKGE